MTTLMGAVTEQLRCIGVIVKSAAVSAYMCCIRNRFCKMNALKCEPLNSGQCGAPGETRAKGATQVCDLPRGQKSTRLLTPVRTRGQYASNQNRKSYM